MKKAFTLVEILVVMAIIAIVAGISYPVFSGVIRASKVSSSTSFLHQLHISMSLYRSEHDGDGRYGGLAEMGFPPVYDPNSGKPDLEGFIQALPEQKLEHRSPCGLNRTWVAEGDLLFQYVFRPFDADDDAARSVAANLYKENWILFYDLNCDFPGTPIGRPDFTHFGVGVNLGGSAVRHSKLGAIFFSDNWWSRPSD